MQDRQRGVLDTHRTGQGTVRRKLAAPHKEEVMPVCCPGLVGPRPPETLPQAGEVPPHGLAEASNKPSPSPPPVAAPSPSGHGWLPSPRGPKAPTGERRTRGGRSHPMMG